MDFVTNKEVANLIISSIVRGMKYSQVCYTSIDNIMLHPWLLSNALECADSRYVVRITKESKF